MGSQNRKPKPSVWLKPVEEWRPLRRFQGYQISNFGNIVDWNGNPVEPFYNDDNVLCVDIHRYEWSYIGPLWQQVLRNFWGGNMLGIDFDYIDGDPGNLHIDNLIPMYWDEDGIRKPARWRRDEQGNKVIDRRLGAKKVMIVETQDVFETVAECAEAIGGNKTAIYSVLRGRAKSHRGFTFVTVDD